MVTVQTSYATPHLLLIQQNLFRRSNNRSRVALAEKVKNIYSIIDKFNIFAAETNYTHINVIQA